MSFDSVDFAYFLPIVFLLYWFVFPRNLKWQNLFVVISSYLFYGWWDWHFLILIAFTSFSAYWSGLLIDKWRDRQGGKGLLRCQAKVVFIATICLNLGILGIFKYYNFFVTNFADAFALFGGRIPLRTLNLVLPVGISFYTFQTLSYTIDVYKNKLSPTKDIIAFFAYVSFFPQLVAGPIERATHLLPQFTSRRTFDYYKASDGMRQILWGLFKKMVIADNCAEHVNRIFESPQDYPAPFLLLGAVLFAFQIYGDFSGYSDIAIGTARLFGIHLNRNFNYPYFSLDIAQFWRRWHMSLNTWFRDYVYIPLGGNRVSKMLIIRNILVVFLLTGLWHGANWTYVAWGGYHALLLLPFILFPQLRSKKEQVAEGRMLPTLGEVLRMICTFFLVTIGWILFRADTISQAFSYIYEMFNFGSVKPMSYFPFLTIGSIVILIFVEWMQRDKQHGLQMTTLEGENKYRISLLPRWLVYISLFLCIFFLHGGQEQFIYFQF